MDPLSVFSLGLDLLDWFTNAQTDAQKQAIDTAYQVSSMATQAAGIQSQIGATQVQLEEAKGKQQAYQSFLSKIPTAGDALVGSTGDLEFDKQYRALLENFGNMNVLAGATGRVGPGTSMALVQNQAQQDVGGFVDVSKEIATRQLGVYTTTIGALNPALEALKAALGTTRDVQGQLGAILGGATSPSGMVGGVRVGPGTPGPGAPSGVPGVGPNPNNPNAPHLGTVGEWWNQHVDTTPMPSIGDWWAGLWAPSAPQTPMTQEEIDKALALKKRAAPLLRRRL